MITHATCNISFSRPRISALLTQPHTDTADDAGKIPNWQEEREVTSFFFDAEEIGGINPQGLDAEIFKNNKGFNFLYVELNQSMVLGEYEIATIRVEDTTEHGLLLSHSDGFYRILIPWHQIKALHQGIHT